MRPAGLAREGWRGRRGTTDTATRDPPAPGEGLSPPRTARATAAHPPAQSVSCRSRAFAAFLPGAGAWPRGTTMSLPGAYSERGVQSTNDDAQVSKL